MKNISKHISYTEGTRSATAIKLKLKNIPNDSEMGAMQNVAKNLFEPIRNHFGVPIAVTSFFRGKEVNSAIGGSTTSQHMLGEAIDVDADVYNGITNEDIFNYVLNSLEYDQIIAEDLTDDGKVGWVHISLKNGLKQRKNAMVMVKHNGTKYFNYDPVKGFKKSNYVS